MRNRNRFQNRLEIALAVVIGATALFVQVRYWMADEWTPTYYFLARDAVRERIRPAKLAEFTAPGALHIQRVDDRSTNVWGWLTSTNSSGIMTTQWFKCFVVQPKSRPHKVIAVELFNENPGWTNPPSIAPKP